MLVFGSELHGALDVVQRLSSPSRKCLTKLVNSSADKKELEDQKAKLSNAFDRLKARSDLHAYSMCFLILLFDEVSEHDRNAVPPPRDC